MTNVATESDKTIISKLVKWNKQHLSDRQSTLILSFFIGLFAAIAAFDDLHTFFSFVFISYYPSFIAR